jgi:hypothetical protein
MNKINWKAAFGVLGYVLLFPAFFVLHGYNAFFGLLPASIVGVLLLKYFAISIFLFALAALLFKRLPAAFVYSIYLLSGYFFFGALHDGLKFLFPNSIITSYSILLPLLLLFSAALYVYLKRSKRSFPGLTSYIRILLLLFVGAEIVVFLYNGLSGKARENNLAASTQWQEEPIDDRSKPDIFFIVFDEYPSSKSLRSEFQFNNDALDSALNDAGFFVSYDSKSNYNFTSYSLASTLSFNYLRVAPQTVLHEKQLLQSIQTLRKNPLTRFLDKQGYDVINYGTYELEQDAVKTVAYFDEFFFKRVIDEQTLWSRIKRDIWWNVSAKDIRTGKLKIPDDFRQQKALEVHRNEYNYQHTIAQIDTTTTRPRFVFSHLLIPHAPYFLDANGEPLSDSAVFFKQFKEDEAFIEQVKYANKLLLNLVNHIKSQKTNRPRVYIIEGDHGYRNFDQRKDGRSAFLNLNAYYFSDQDYTLLYDGISPVNTFRVVLNKYFKAGLPILKDSSVYVIDPR